MDVLKVSSPLSRVLRLMDNGKFKIIAAIRQLCLLTTSITGICSKLGMSWSYTNSAHSDVERRGHTMEIHSSWHGRLQCTSSTKLISPPLTQASRTGTSADFVCRWCVCHNAGKEVPASAIRKSTGSGHLRLNFPLGLKTSYTWT